MTPHAEIAEIQSGAILRLSADSWSVLADYLDSGDALRLLATGNRVLADRLRYGVQSLKVTWASSRYINLDHALEQTSAFKSLYSFEFSEPRFQVRCWTPMKWTLLPPTLTSLSLSFAGAPGFLLQPEVCIHWPNLLRLNVVDLFLDRGPAWEDEPYSSIYLRHLPLPLQHLRIKSSRPLITDPIELTRLPPDLEKLELDFSPNFRRGTPRVLNNRVVFPSLPHSIKYLMFKDDHSDHWLINCAKLPKSLETLIFKVSHFVAVHGEVTSRNCTSCSFEGMSASLPNLTVLNMRDVRTPTEVAIRLIPSTVTRLSLSFAEEGEEEAKLAAKHFGSKLIEHYTGWRPLDVSLFDGNIELPHLNRLNLRISNDFQVRDLPQHIQKLEVSHLFDGQVPLSVTKFEIATSWGSEPLSGDHFSITPQHKITSLRMCHHFKLEWLERLPNTLESFAAEFEDNVWYELMRMISSGRLSNISSLQSRKARLELDCLISNPMPPQLKSLSIKVSSDLLGKPLNRDHLSNLRSSGCLESLSLVIDGAPWRDPASFFDLMNSLPSHLKTLAVTSGYIPSVQWPVVLPSTLTDLEFVVTAFDEALQSLENWISDLDENGHIQAASFKLPNSLVRYHHVDDSKPLPLESFPPTLSIFQIQDLELRNAYYASRESPSPGLKLDIPVYTGTGGDD